MSAKIPVGIGACCNGSKTSSDSESKRCNIARMFAPLVHLQPVCLKMVSAPEASSCLSYRTQRCNHSFGRCCAKCQKTSESAQSPASFPMEVASLSHLCGFIVCAKLQRDSLTQPPGSDPSSNRKTRVGTTITDLLFAMPWLPIVEEDRLSDPVVRDNFVERFCALHEFNQFCKSGATCAGLIAFHSKYKLLLLAHCQQQYRELGRFIAGAGSQHPLTECLEQYRLRFMSLLSIPATQRNHTNVLMHVQGYFRHRLTIQQRQELSSLIDSYRQGRQPLSAPVALLKYYMTKYPNVWLSQQRYFQPYPKARCMRFGYQLAAKE